MPVLRADKQIALAVLVPIDRGRTCRVSLKDDIAQIPFVLKPGDSILVLHIAEPSHVLTINNQIHPSISVPIHETDFSSSGSSGLAVIQTKRSRLRIHNSGLITVNRAVCAIK